MIKTTSTSTPFKFSDRGPLESTVYAQELRSSRKFQRSLLKKQVDRRLDRKPSQTGSVRSTLGALRAGASVEDIDDSSQQHGQAPEPARIVARLLLARLFDQNPNPLEMSDAGSVVLIDVPDPLVFSAVARFWKSAPSFEGRRFAKFESLSQPMKDEDFDGIALATSQSIKPSERPTHDARAFIAVQSTLPIIAITPAANTHLSMVLVDAATARLTLPLIDAALVGQTIRLVTGKSCKAALLREVAAAQVGLREILLSIRWDRAPRQCVENLVRLVAKKKRESSARDLTLDQLHGLDDAVAWAKSTIADLNAWRRGEIGWSEIDTGMVLNGPSGTGKTTLARTFATAAGLPLIAATHSKWQASGEGHLGHMLRAMRQDFEDARVKATPAAVMLIDELDSFADRSQITHAHKDYAVQVVNSLIELIDGIAEHRLIFIGCTNDVRRCDPALIRPGRFNRVIEVSLPSPSDLEKMFRVRLRGDLADESIEDIALLAVGSTGADVERIVKDARRAARVAGRPVSMDHLRSAIVGDDTLPEELMVRTAFHEAGHIIASVIHNGPADVHAVIGAVRGATGFVTSLASNCVLGSLEECHRSLQILLAGRAAEEIVFQCPANGAAGDLAAATRIAAAMVGAYGLAGPHPLVCVADHLETEKIIAQRYMRQAVQTELASALGVVKALLLEHREALTEVAAFLRQEGRIDGFEVQEIMQSSAKAQYANLFDFT